MELKLRNKLMNDLVKRKLKRNKQNFNYNYNLKYKISFNLNTNVRTSFCNYSTKSLSPKTRSDDPISSNVSSGHKSDVKYQKEGTLLRPNNYFNLLSIDDKMCGINGSIKSHYFTEGLDFEPNHWSTPQKTTNFNKSCDLSSNEKSVQSLNKSRVESNSVDLSHNLVFKSPQTLRPNLRFDGNTLKTNSYELKSRICEKGDNLKIKKELSIDLRELMDELKISYGFERQKFSEKIPEFVNNIPLEICHRLRQLIVKTGSPLNRRWLLNVIELRKENRF